MNKHSQECPTARKDDADTIDHDDTIDKFVLYGTERDGAWTDGEWIGFGERVALGASFVRPVLELVPSFLEGFTIEPRSKFWSVVMDVRPQPSRS